MRNEEEDRQNVIDFGALKKEVNCSSILSEEALEKYYNAMTKEKRLKEVIDLGKIKFRNDDGRFYIYINRKMISAYSRKDLIEKLYEYLFGEENFSLEHLFPKWMMYKRDIEKANPKTLQEYRFEWKSVFAGTEITKTPLPKLTAKDFDKFFRTLTTENAMTRKRFNDRKSILNGIYSYAVLQDIVPHNPIKELNFRHYHFIPENKKVDIYTKEERAKLLKYLATQDNIYSLAIQLDFYIIARIGEIKALKHSDISGNFIYIQRQLLEHQEMNDNLSFNPRKVIEVSHVKGNTSAGYRKMPLTREAKEILYKARELNPNGKYIFMEDERPLTTVTFNRYLKKACKELNIPYRSSHKIRFTVASLLYNQKVLSETKLQELLGHTTLAMTLHYLRATDNDDETLEAMTEFLDERKIV